MNEQEAIEKIKNLEGLTILDKTINFDSEMIPRKKVLNIVNQIDGPEKPVVPRCVADMIVKRKRAGQSVVKAIENLRFYEDACKWVRNNGETFVKAWLYGYEVEKEQLYTVEIPNPNGDGYGVVYLGRNEYNKIELRIWDCYSSIEFSDNWKQFDNAQLTESEIKEDFEWAWQFAEGVQE